MAAPSLAGYDAAYPPDPARGAFACWDIDAIEAGPQAVQTGVDVVFGGDPRGGLPGAYLPCQSRGAAGRPDDPYYAACQTGAYYKFVTGFDFPVGIFIDDENNGVRHLFGQRVVSSALEIYPRLLQDGKMLPDLEQHGRVRVATGTRLVGGVLQDAFPHRANGGSYTLPVGTVRLPTAGDPGVGRVNGYALRADGSPGAIGEFHLSLFQDGGEPYASSAGYPLASFAAGDSKDAAGYYTSGLIRPGTYAGNAVRYRLDAAGAATHEPAVHVRFRMQAPVDRVDFHLGEPDLGLSRYGVVSDITYVVGGPGTGSAQRAPTAAAAWWRR